MARRVKAQLDEFKVDSALEDMIDITDLLDDADVIMDVIDNEDSVIDVDHLAQQIALATAENSELEKQLTTPAVDNSVAEQLFNKPSVDSSIPAGTVQEQVITQPLKAANDDRGTLWANRSEKKLSFKRLYLGTTALSALWAAGGVAFAHNLSAIGIFSISSIGSFLSSPMGLALSAGTVLPIAMFWGFAQLTKRSKELQSAIYSISDAATRLVAPVSSPEEQLNQIGTNVRQEIQMMNQGIEKTISRAVELEALIQGEVKNLERAYTENESRIHNLIKELSSEREAILGHADQVKSIIRASQDQLSGEFSSITSNITNGIEDITNTLSHNVKESGEKLIQQLQSASEEVSQKISDRIDNNTQNLSISFNNSTEKALTDFETKLIAFDKKLLDRTNVSITSFDDNVSKLSDRFNTVSSIFNSATEEAIHAFEDRLSNIDNLLSERSSSIIHAFIARAESLDQNTDKLGDILEERISRISQTLKDRTDDISNAFERGHTQIESALQQRISDVNTIFTGNNNQIHTAFSKYIEDMSKVVGGNYQTLNDILQKRLIEITSAYEGGNTKVSTTLNAYAEKVFNSLNDSYVQFSNYLEQRSNEIIKAFDGKNDLTNENLKARAVEIEKAFEKGWSFIDETLNRRIQEITHNINGSQNNLDETIKNNLTEIMHLFNHKRDEISNSMRERLLEIKTVFEGERSNIDSLVQVVASRLENEADKIDQTISNVLENRTDNLIYQLDNGRLNFENAVKNTGDEIIVSVNEKLGTLTNNIYEIEKTISNKIQLVNNHITDHSENIDIRTHALVQALENNKEYLNTLSKQTDIITTTTEKVSNLYNAFENTTDKLHQTFNVQGALIEEQANVFNKSIENSLSLISYDLNQHTSQISNTFNAMLQNASISAGDIGDKLNQTVSSFESGIEQARYTLSLESDRVAESFQEKINTVTQNVSNKISQSSAILTEASQEASKNIEVAVAAIGERISNAVNIQIDNFSTHVENINKVSETVSIATEQTSQSLVALSHEFTQKLNDASIIVKEDIRKGNEELITSFSNQATETITSIQSAHNNIYENMNIVLSNVDGAVDKLNQSATTLQNNANEFVNNIQAVDEKIAQSTLAFTDNVREARETLDQSSSLLNSNIVQMKNLGQDFSNHSTILETAASLLQDAQNNFATSLENQHTEINNITSSLAKKSDELAEKIKLYSSLLFDKVKEAQAYSKESAYETQNELSSLIENAIHKFSTATEEIRKTVKAVDTEIHVMTSDIHQSIETMPIQAKISTESMRNAISDQIYALKELTHLMSQSASFVETTNAAEQSQQTFIPHKIEREQKNNTKALSSGNTDLISNKSKKKEGSWVSELLARASRDDKENELEQEDVQVLADIKTIAQNIETRKEPVQEPIESLNSIANEIVKAFNGNEIVALWGDYRRGRRNINPQKLYTINGQSTYKRVSNKFQKDADFMQSVNQYIADFEHVLRDVQKSYGKEEVRNYLVSDPGKVYTMLAQISGRIQ